MQPSETMPKIPALKVWRVTAWTGLPNRKNSHTFTSCDVIALNREEARRKANDRIDIISDPKAWTGGAGHAKTITMIRTI